MKVDRIKNLVIAHRQSNLVKLMLLGYSILYGLTLFLCTYTGYIPSHTLRNLTYRHLFRVKLKSDSTIYWRCRFFDPWGVHIGHNSKVGNDAFLDGRCGVFIGNNVNIAGECRIYTQEHDIASPTFAATGAAVHLGDYTYVGTRVTILPGVTIGEGAVLASGCVVTKNVDPWTMVGGVPAKFIKRRPEVRYTLNPKSRVLFQ